MNILDHESSHLREVDFTRSSNNKSSSLSSSNSYLQKNDVELVLSSGTRPPAENDVKFDQHEVCDPYKDMPTAETPNLKLPILVFVWQFLTRATLGVFVLLNDTDKHEDTQSLMFMISAMLTLLNMLLLSVLKDRKHHHLACAYAVYSAAESVVLVMLSDFLFLTFPILSSVWFSVFVVGFQPCSGCYKTYKRKKFQRSLKKQEDEQNRSPDEEGANAHFIAGNEKKKICCTRKRLLCLRVCWFLFLSLVSEACNLVYFWFLIELFEFETNIRKQRIILCCVNLKLLMTAYTRHMLFERRFSLGALCSEFVLFVTTSTTVYCYTFLTLTENEHLILREIFWSALALEIFVNFIMFVKFSRNAF